MCNSYFISGAHNKEVQYHGRKNNVPNDRNGADAYDGGRSGKLVTTVTWWHGQVKIVNAKSLSRGK